MVVFSADYWAPGMDNKSGNSVVASNAQLHPTNPNTHHNHRRQPSTKDKNLLNPVIPNSIFSSPAAESLSDFGAESTKDNTPCNTTKKKDYKSKRNLGSSNLNSAKGSENELLVGVKSVWLDMLSTKVNRKPSQSSKDSKKDMSLQQKYGICEKRCIGRGATAVVRIAHKTNSEDKEDERLYAIKEFRKRRKNETEREYIKKLTGEFCISSTLHHINIVETIDLIQDEHKNWCEVMEYCEGGDLYNIIKNGSMSVNEINCCFKQLINGIEYLHSMGVAHRDIKPENLLVTNTGILKITDFGVSDVFRTAWEIENHKSKGLCGSEPYISPEQFSQKEYDARAVDIWACAIVYYAMIYRSIPFKQATISDTTYKKFTESYNTKSFSGFKAYNEGCKLVMYKMLNPDPLKRANVSEIICDKWFVSIETCVDCMASLGFHDHFSSDYTPPKKNNQHQN